MTATDPTDLLTEALAGREDGFVELRYHSKRQRTVRVEKGRLDSSQVIEHTGVGVRVIDSGGQGFAATGRLEAGAVGAAIERARRAARAASGSSAQAWSPPPSAELARGRFEGEGVQATLDRPLEELLDLVLGQEARVRASSGSIESASCGYNEILEEKGIVTNDGAKAWTRLVRPEFRVGAVARGDGEIQRGSRSVGVCGGWECLFQHEDPDKMGDEAARIAVDRLRAGYPEGGRTTVLLSPALVGMLTHEAIGHTVEADLVEAGTVAKGRLGTRVASELITLCDSGHSEHLAGAGGTLFVDDEGVPAQRTVVIERGILKSYLHDRASAAREGVAPTGNARAWEYDDEPLIRMRNTYIEPGQQSLEELIAGIEDGYLLDSPSNGQADSNGEFMFGTMEAYRIKNGVKGPLLRGVNLAGKAFDVLGTVDGVSREFRWDLGSGHCGKGQPMKVDAGGPWLRCRAILGGRQ
jgi:TldD protein